MKNLFAVLVAILIAAIAFVVMNIEGLLGTQVDTWLQTNLPSVSKDEFNFIVGIIAFVIGVGTLLISKIIRSIRG